VISLGQLLCAAEDDVGFFQNIGDSHLFSSNCLPPCGGPRILVTVTYFRNR
jgi:hypothetical protein